MCYQLDFHVCHTKLLYNRKMSKQVTAIIQKNNLKMQTILSNNTIIYCSFALTKYHLLTDPACKNSHLQSRNASVLIVFNACKRSNIILDKKKMLIHQVLKLTFNILNKKKKYKPIQGMKKDTSFLLGKDHRLPWCSILDTSILSSLPWRGHGCLGLRAKLLSLVDWYIYHLQTSNNESLKIHHSEMTLKAEVQISGKKYRIVKFHSWKKNHLFPQGHHLQCIIAFQAAANFFQNTIKNKSLWIWINNYKVAFVVKTMKQMKGSIKWINNVRSCGGHLLLGQKVWELNPSLAKFKVESLRNVFYTHFLTSVRCWMGTYI